LMGKPGVQHDEKPSYSAKAEYPVRRGLSNQWLTSVEYWIARLLFSPET
jgi:hypothetical protein